MNYKDVIISEARDLFNPFNYFNFFNLFTPFNYFKV